MSGIMLGADVKRSDGPRGEIKQQDSNFSLELAGRNNGDSENNAERENTVLTISIDGDVHNLEILPDDFQCQQKLSWFRQKLQNRVEVILLTASFLLLVVSMCLLESLKLKKASSARILLLIMRSVGIFTFFGQLSMFLAKEITFSGDGCSCKKKSSYIEIRRVTQILKHFLLSVIFEETIVTDYFRRVNTFQEQNLSKCMLEMLDNTELDGYVSDKIEQLFLSAEGGILDVLGIGKVALCSFSKSFIGEIMCNLHSIVHKNMVINNLTHEEIRRHIEVIANQQFNALDKKDANQFLKKIAAQKLSKMSLIFFACMTFAGCMVQLVYTFGLLET